MARKFTRKMKGGDLNIDNVKTTIGQLKDDVIRISNDIEKLGKDLELNGVHEVVTEEVTPEVDVLLENNNDLLTIQENDTNNEITGSPKTNLSDIKSFELSFKGNKITIGKLEDLIKFKKNVDNYSDKYKNAYDKFYRILNNNKDLDEETIKSRFQNFLNNNEKTIFELLRPLTIQERQKNNKNTSGWTFGGRKTKKNQRKSRKHNKSRK
jgi:hypothetical protein